MTKIKTKVKTFFLLALVLFGCLPLSPMKAEAATNRVDTDHIAAVVEKDGDVRITEVMHGTFKEGSENYLVKLQGTGIEDYSVSMDGKAFTYDENAGWGSSGDIEDKAYKYGFYYDGDVELCWGISDYGEHTYTVSYTMKDQAHTYGEDGDGFNIRFFNDKWGNGPTDVTVTLSVEGMELTDDNSSIWSFGFEGTQGYEGGKAFVDAPDIEEINYVTVMMSLEPGSLPEAGVEDRSWEEVYEQAIEDSDYQKAAEREHFISMAVFIIPLIPSIIFCFGIPFFGIIMGIIKQKKAQKTLMEATMPYRDIPLEGNLSIIAAVWGALPFDDCDEKELKPNLIRAYLLKMIYKGYIRTYTADEGLQLIKAPEDNGEPGNAVMGHLYDIMEKYADASRVISKHTLRSSIFGEEMYAFGESCYLDGLVRANKQGLVPASYGLRKYKTYSGRTNVPAFRNAVTEVLGFYKYLTDNTLIDERRAKEVVIWKQYMEIASVLGIADKVEDEFKLAVPEADYIEYNEFDTYYHSGVDHSYSTSYSSHNYSSSSSGSSSSGGGGGSSGGGSGGGSR